MTSLIHYTPSQFSKLNTPDVKLWLSTVRVAGDNISFIDRTGLIVPPVRVTSLPINRLPVFDPNFNLSFGECAARRAEFIYNKHLEFGVPIRLQWSGGIDSTSALLSFVELLGAKRAAEIIEVSMTHTTIMENPTVWEQIVRPNGFKIVNSAQFTEPWDGSAIMVNGEEGDQCTGSDLYRGLLGLFPDTGMKTPYTHENFAKFVKMRSFSPLLGMPAGISDIDADRVTAILAEQFATSPVPIRTMADALAWMNLTFKWCSTFWRLVTKSDRQLSSEFIENHYFPFYASDEFQQWSMTPNGEKHKGTWSSYKWKAKEYICKVVGNQELMLKFRLGSLLTILVHTHRANAIDDQFNMLGAINANEWYNPNNTFNQK